MLSHINPVRADPRVCDLWYNWTCWLVYLQETIETLAREDKRQITDNRKRARFFNTVLWISAHHRQGWADRGCHHKRWRVLLHIHMSSCPVYYFLIKPAQWGEVTLLGYTDGSGVLQATVSVFHFSFVGKINFCTFSQVLYNFEVFPFSATLYFVSTTFTLNIQSVVILQIQIIQCLQAIHCDVLSVRYSCGRDTVWNFKSV